MTQQTSTDNAADLPPKNYTTLQVSPIGIITGIMATGALGSRQLQYYGKVPKGCR